MELNKDQKKAANHLEGNLLIIASAGTGKTTTIIERYVNLIEDKKIDPSQIMMTTFTNKAAKDMIKKIKQRTNKISPYVGTMHSLFLRVLRDYSNLIFNGKDFTLLTDNKEKNKIIRDILKKENLESNTNAVRYFSSWISKYKNRGIFEDQLSEKGSIDDLKETGQITEMLDDEMITVDPLWRKEVNRTYKRYQEYLEKNKLLDFDEILMKSFKLFEENPKIKEIYKNKFKAIMVDEAQDLNLIQKNILDQISSENLCFIGDDCQNIYEWRGSSNQIIFDFSEIETNFFLKENYRSSREIIDAVNKIIEKMKFKIDKKLIATKNYSQKINIKHHPNSFEEIEETILKIKDLLNKENPEDIAILFRTNQIGKQFERELIKQGIPCHLSKSVNFFEREEIKDLISLLRFKINKDSFFDLEKISKIIPGLGKKNLNKIKEFSENKGISLKKTLEDLEQIPIKESLKEGILNILKSLNEKDIQKMIVKSGYYSYLKYKYFKEPSKFESKMENIELFKELYENNYSSILDFLDSIQEIEKKEPTEGKIILSTIHSAKGLEWKHVFLVGCNEGILPFYKEELTPLKNDSELRLFYVAISRAKEGLYISSHFFNGLKSLEPSNFLEII